MKSGRNRLPIGSSGKNYMLSNPGGVRSFSSQGPGTTLPLSPYMDLSDWQKHSETCEDMFYSKIK